MLKSSAGDFQFFFGQRLKATCVRWCRSRIRAEIVQFTELEMEFQREATLNVDQLNNR